MPVSTVSMLLPMAEPLPVIAATAVLLVVLVRARTELLSMLAATTELLGVLVRAKEVMLSTLAATTQLPVVLAHVPTELLLMLATTTELLSVLATTEQLAVLVRATTELLFMLAATTQLLSMLLAPTAERLSVLTTTMELLSMLVLTTGLLSLLVPTTELLPVLAETTELLSTLPVPATEPLSASAPTTELLSLLVPATELLSLLVPATEPMSVPVRAMTKLLPLPVPTGPLFVVVPTMLLMLVPATELLYMLVPVKPSLGLCSVSASASAMLPRRTQLARPSRGRCSAAVPMPVVMKLQLVRMPTAKLLLAPAPGTTKLLSMLVPTTGLQSVLVPATELLYMLVPVKPSHGLCSIAALPRRTTGETLTWSLFRADGTAATRGTCVLPQPADPTGEALTWSLFRAGGTVCDAVPPRLGGTAVGVGVDTASISHTDSGTPGLAGPLTRDREHAMWNLFREPLYVTAAECRRDSGGAPPFACPVRWVVHHTAATPGGVPGLLPIAASGGVKSRWALSTCVARRLLRGKVGLIALQETHLRPGGDLNFSQAAKAAGIKFIGQGRTGATRVAGAHRGDATNRHGGVGIAFNTEFCGAKHLTAPDAAMVEEVAWYRITTLEHLFCLAVVYLPPPRRPASSTPPGEMSCLQPSRLTEPRRACRS